MKQFLHFCLPLICALLLLYSCSKLGKDEDNNTITISGRRFKVSSCSPLIHGGLFCYAKSGITDVTSYFGFGVDSLVPVLGSYNVTNKPGAANEASIYALVQDTMYIKYNSIAQNNATIILDTIGHRINIKTTNAQVTDGGTISTMSANIDQPL